MDSTNPSLIERAKSGDEKAWEAIFEIYAPFLDYWIRRWGAAEALADVRQDVLLRAWRGLPNFQQGATGSFRGWLLVITRNAVREHYARNQHLAVAAGGSALMQQIAQLPDQSVESEADVAVPETVEIELLRRAVELLRVQLSDQAWTIFRESAIAGRSSREVAEQLGIQAPAVRKSKARTMEQLRGLLGGLRSPDCDRLL